MPRPKINHTQEQKRLANQLKSKRSYHKRKEEINARRRALYHQKKRTQPVVVAEEEHNWSNSPRSPSTASEPSLRALKCNKKSILKLEIEANMTAVRCLKNHFDRSTQGSTRGFLAKVCQDFDKSLRSGSNKAAVAAYEILEEYLDEFKALSQMVRKQ
ncbi:hypothetical protein EST38_g6008 [Candolleomyces aberdarensis]|uniref:Uncharacterized protein n=1 Tax=Candolleomyces aberdarensis TaxID=2316362 RepID=A0A4Q2DIM9_9AGAR|nr:hypothetical protein EST38_g6008 [Candolleomyces aberdarensis]